MTKHLFATSLALILAATLSPAQEKKMADGPGTEHAALMKLAGEYTTVIKFKANPEDAGRETKGTSKFSNVLDGRFILEEANFDMFDQAYKARKIYGYNNAAKRYESAWIFTGSTAIMTLNGPSADGGKTIQLTGGFEIADGKKANFNVTMKRINDDSFVVQFGVKTADGAGSRMETTYTRKK